MRAVALFAALLLATAGCRSSRERPDRDYMSLNRRSVDYLFETFREGRKIRKKSLKQTVAFSQRAPENRRIRRESAGYAWQTLWMDEGKGLQRIWQGLGGQVKSKGARAASMRFGFLDSGD